MSHIYIFARALFLAALFHGFKVRLVQQLLLIPGPATDAP